MLERITLLLLKHIFDPDLSEKLPEILMLLQEVDQKENVLEILEVLLRYVVTATKKIDEHDLKEILSKSFIEEDIMQTFIDKYIEQGKNRDYSKDYSKEYNKVYNKECMKFWKPNYVGVLEPCRNK